MTKTEAIKFIESCKNEPYGFFVVAISREDVAVHCTEKIINEFDNYSMNRQEKILSDIADEMNDVFQENNFSDNFDNVCMENIMNT